MPPRRSSDIATRAQARTATLDDKYVAESGRVLISGVQALVRLMLDQRRLDRRRGLDTAVYASGYPGSPLAGLDRELHRARAHLEPAGVRVEPGVNEELAATAIAGTQLLGDLPGRRHDGVVGFWFGKNPGLDRAADAIRHGNVSGTAPLGGAVALIGDDPGCKSSTIPSTCEAMCRSLALPLLAPGSVAEVLELGLHAVALSRAAGTWTGLKILADVADACATVDVSGLLDGIPAPRRRERPPAPTLLGAAALDPEHDLLTTRLAAVRRYAQDAGLNRIAFEPRRPRLAVVAAGTAYQAVLRALSDLGIDAPAREALGMRLVKIGMPWPLHGDDLAALLAGVEEVLVVEDKLPFLESQIKEGLYRRPGAPVVIGKHDELNRPLLSPRGTIGSDEVARALMDRLPAEDLPARAHARVMRLRAAAEAPPARRTLPVRTPHFCSGCPHSASTASADGQLVGAGIGCHILVTLNPAGRGTLVGSVQMGGEGAQWLGLAPFTDDPHFVQNLGDGTFHHSGSLAIRAAAASGANITYRLLYNDAIAMTGGQRPAGKMDVPALTRWLALEGARRIIVTADDPGRYRGVRLDPIAEVRGREGLERAQEELAAIPGLTVLLHDDRCATEERRMRRKGEIPTPAGRPWINERVCEGCGDCGRKSTCLSVVPVETELGRKTRIHQSSCNQDTSCLAGDCPSFLLVEPGRRERREPPPVPFALPEPHRRVSGQEVLLHMPGVGGTGVVTASQVLQMASHLEGRHAAGLEQTGLSQKGGPVISDLRLAARPIEGALRAGTAAADVLVGFDLLGASAPAALAVADPRRTVAVVSTSIVATGAMVADAAVPLPARERALAAIDAATRRSDNLYLDAQGISERLFDDHMQANMVLVGALFQHGCLPLGAESIEAAIRINAVSVAANLAAFRWGRATAADPAAARAALFGAGRERPAPSARTVRILDRHGVAGALRELMEVRVEDLIGYQDAAYAARYAESVMRVAARERERLGREGTPIAEAYARGLHKLMAYKDEYEVARLHLDAAERARLDEEMGPGARVRFLIHPPALRALGLRRKLRLGRSAVPMFRALRAVRGLRGGRLDPFGRARVRRIERELPGEYERMVAGALERLAPETAGLVLALAELPDLVRGYEEIKLANVEAFRARAAELRAELAQPPAPPRERRGVTAGV